MRGPLVTARDRRNQRANQLIKRVLLTALMVFFIAGAIYTDHLYLMTYGN